jgi:hypothetical protein
MGWFQRRGAAAALGLFISSAAHAETDADLTWFGNSNSGGGEVSFGYSPSALNPSSKDFNPENSESMAFTIRCNAFDKSIDVRIPYDVDDKFKIGTTISIAIDGMSKDYASSVSYIGGDYTAIPMLEISAGDPLLKFISAGSSAVVSLEKTEIENLDLSGSSDVISRHLKACL